VFVIGVLVGLAQCSSTTSGDGGGSGSPGTASGHSSGSSSSGSSGEPDLGGSGSGDSAGDSSDDGGSSADDAGPVGDATIDAATTDAGAHDAAAHDARASVGGNCKVADITPCSSFTTITGDTIQLGPYGAQMDVNVGKGFENALQSGDMLPQNAGTCQTFAGIFNQTADLTSQLLTTSMNGITIDFTLYSVYRPAVWPSAPVPVITWGNGTCAQPEGYGALLRYVASFGYFIVAPNMRWVSSDAPPPMTHALDYAAAANKDSSSPYYGKLDTTKVGAMGHSQGGQATASAANSDSRILYAIDFNAVDTGIKKPYLAVSGDKDITNWTASQMSSDIDGNAFQPATEPAAYLFYHHPEDTNPDGGGVDTGHLVLMLQPQRVMGPTKDWWEMWFRNSATARAQFIGSGCGLCTSPPAPNDFDYGHNGLLK
jgi:hypothetical protein